MTPKFIFRVYGLIQLYLAGDDSSIIGYGFTASSPETLLFKMNNILLEFEGLDLTQADEMVVSPNGCKVSFNFKTVFQ